MRPLVASRWEDVGVQLLNEKNRQDINIIKANYPRDVQKCCSNLLDVWQQKQPQDVTWEKLIEAIKNVGLIKEAEEIKNLFLTPTGRRGICLLVWPIVLHLIHFFL